MNRLRKLAAYSLLGLALGVGNADAQDAQLSAKSTSAARLSSAVANGGSVRVIVRLSGGADGAQLTQADRQQNRSLQETFSTSFLAGGASRASRNNIRNLTDLPMMALTVNANDLSALANDARIEKIWIDELRRPGLVESVPMIGMSVPLTANVTGADTMVAVLDTGVDKNHAFIGPNVVKEACFSTTDSVNESTSLCSNGAHTQFGAGAAADCLASGQNRIDGCGHGTHVAGIIAGKGTGSPSRGVVPEAKVFAVKVFSKFTALNCGVGVCALAYDSDVIAGLAHIRDQVSSGALTQTMASINMSLGGGEYTTACDDHPAKPVIDQLKALNVATVIASGNEALTSKVGAPACISSAVTVGATSKTDVLASFSNSASMVDLLAPGVDIMSAESETQGFIAYSGTSMAASHVAGAFAAMRSALPNATVDQITNALKVTGTPVTDGRITGGQTKPRIRVDLALSNMGFNGLIGGKAFMVTPTAGSALTSSTAFTWNPGTNVSSYYLYVGNIGAGSNNIYTSAHTGTTATVPNISGANVYVRLWSLISGTWKYNDYTYTGPVTSTKAAMTSPAQGATIGASATFNWTTGTQVSSYWLHVGTTFAGNNIHSSAHSGTTATVSNIPSGTIYVRLWSLISGYWQFADYTYISSTPSAPAAMSSPVAGSTLSASTTFTWTAGQNVTSYYLHVGTAVAANNVYSSAHTATSATVGNIPSGTIFVRLWSLISGVWQFSDYTYTGPVQVAALTAPTVGSALTSNQTFTWSAAPGATGYWLHIGSQFATANHFNQSMGTATSAVVNLSAVPAGQPVYVRVWTSISGVWHLKDYVFTKGSN